MVNRHAALTSNLDDLNNIEETAKTKFTMEIANKEKDLEFLDLRIKCVLEKILVDVFAKSTNSFTYVVPSTCYLFKNMNSVPCGIAFELCRICDTNEKFKSRADKCKQNL